MRRLSTTLSKEYFDTLEKYAKKFGTQKSVIEKALDLLDQRYNPFRERTDEIIWSKLREELDHLSISRTFLIHLIKGEFDTAAVDNASEYLVSWYLKKPVRDATLGELLDGVKKMYEASNHFKRIEYIKRDGEFVVTFWHFMGMEYSRFMTKYFVNFFEKLGFPVTPDVMNVCFVIKICEQ
jgi:hypothetical protein